MKKSFLLCCFLCFSLLNYPVAAKEARKYTDPFSDSDLRQLFIITGTTGLLKGVEYGGLVLFKQDFQRLNNSACSLKKEFPHTTLFTDQEGGEVVRLSINPPPDPKKAYTMTLEQFKQAVSSSAKSLKNACIDANLAPVVEINHSDRSYGNNYQAILDYSSVFSRSMNQAGVFTVIKHFPGSQENCHPLTNLSKLGLTLKKNSEATICRINDEEDLKKQLDLFTQVPSQAIMIGQNIYSNISPYPAFLEPKYRQWIVNDLHYNKVIISDALWEINAEPNTIIMALKTVDWVMVGYSRSVEEALPLIHQAIREGILSTKEIQDKLNKIQTFKISKL